MAFYKECIGGELTLQKVADSPIAAQCPAAMQDQILHATLTRGALMLMGSDMQGPGGYQHGNNIALSLNCSSEEEINDFYKSLAIGGSIIDELKVQFWGAMFGVIEDQFGIRWMLHYDKNQQQ